MKNKLDDTIEKISTMEELIFNKHHAHEIHWTMPVEECPQCREIATLKREKQQYEKTILGMQCTDEILSISRLLRLIKKAMELEKEHV